MSYTDKKNGWWRIDNTEAGIVEKATEIFRMVATKFPTLETAKNGTSAKFTSKGVTIFFKVKYCVSRPGNTRVLLRFSNVERDLDIKSLRSRHESLTNEVREGSKYYDNSSRINLDYIFDEVEKAIESISKSNDEKKKDEFLRKIEQMKLVGRIKMCINDNLYDVIPCPYATIGARILNKEKKGVLTIARFSAEKLSAHFENWGRIFVHDKDLEHFINDCEGILKYVNV